MENTNEAPQTPEAAAVKELFWFKKVLKEVRMFLISFKVIFVSLIVFNASITREMIAWFEANHDKMNEAGAAGFISIVLAIVANLKWAMEKSVD